MKNQLLILISLISSIGAFAQSPTYYAERYDTADFTYWSDGYDKYDITHEGNSEAVVSYFMSKQGSTSETYTEFDFPAVINISDSSIISIEILQPKNFDYSVVFEAVDVLGNVSVTNQESLPMSSKSEIYNLEFTANDSIDFNNIDKIRMYKTRSLTGFNTYGIGHGDLDFGIHALVDFYVGAISIGKKLVEVDALVRNTVIFNEGNWDLDSKVMSGSVSLDVIDEKLMLIDTAVSTTADSILIKTSFTIKLDDSINLLDHPFLSLKFKTNKDIKISLDASDNIFGSDFSGKWNVQTDSVQELFSMYDLHTKNVNTSVGGCASIYNVDLNVDNESLRSTFNIIHIDSINSVTFAAYYYVSSEPLEIEIEEIVVGDVREEPSLFTVDVYQDIQDYLLNSYLLELSMEFSLSEDIDYTYPVNIYLSKDGYFSEDDTLIGTEIIDADDFTLTTQIYMSTEYANAFLANIDASTDNRGTLFFEYEKCSVNKFFSVAFDYSIALSTEEDVLRDELTIFPNPTVSKLTIENEGLDVEQISIYNTSGLLVKTVANDVTTLNVSELENGVYLLEVQTKSGLSQRRFVKQ